MNRGKLKNLATLSGLAPVTVTVKLRQDGVLIFREKCSRHPLELTLARAFECARVQATSTEKRDAKQTDGKAVAQVSA